MRKDTRRKQNCIYRGDNGEVYEEYFGGVKDYSNGDTYKFQ